VNLLSNIVAIAAGQDHSLALDGNGNVYAWGNNDEDQLGVNINTRNTVTPDQVNLLSNIVAIAAGQDHSLALDGNGNVYAWGKNYQGQLGIGYSGPGLVTPVKVSFDDDIVITDISAGVNNSFAVDNNGIAYGWGTNNNGEVGNAKESARQETPDKVVFDPSGFTSTSTVRPDTFVKSIHAGRSCCFAVDDEGYAYSWGNNIDGMLSNGVYGGKRYRSNNVFDGIANGKFVPITNISTISAGDRHVLAIDNEGGVYNWGDNDQGQLATNDRDNEYLAVKAPSLSGVTNISAGASHSLFILSQPRNINKSESSLVFNSSYETLQIIKTANKKWVVNSS
jgi:alpha-tubulin suppressor-like RCC1 family protein